MSSFTDDLIVRIEQGETRGRGTATLVAPFRYEVGALGSGDVISVPVGFRTDFCSSPRWARWLLSNFDGAAKAAVVHDYLWSQQPRTRPRREIDAIYNEALGVLKVARLKRQALWLGVRLQALMTRDR